jgi:integrase
MPKNQEPPTGLYNRTNAAKDRHCGTRAPTPPAARILDKYKNHPVGPRLTFHIARHTFATTITLDNGVPIESVSQMLGHKFIKTTQVYAKVSDKSIKEDMKVVFGKYADAINKN